MAHSWFQHVLALNRNTVGWMEVYIFLRRFRNERVAEKVENPFAVATQDIFSMVEFRKRITSRNTRDRFDENRCTA
jgi:hypothetical protein